MSTDLHDFSTLPAFEGPSVMQTAEHDCEALWAAAEEVRTEQLLLPPRDAAEAAELKWRGNPMAWWTAAQPSQALAGVQLRVVSTVPGVELTLSRVVSFQRVGTHGCYVRRLTVTTVGDHARAEGRIVWHLGQLTVDLSVRQGTPMTTIIERMALQLCAQLGGLPFTTDHLREQSNLRCFTFLFSSVPSGS